MMVQTDHISWCLTGVIRCTYIVSSPLKRNKPELQENILNIPFLSMGCFHNLGVATVFKWPDRHLCNDVFEHRLSMFLVKELPDRGF